MAVQGQIRSKQLPKRNILYNTEYSDASRIRAADKTDADRSRKRGVILMKRENFGSRLGFLLVSAGCAIGIGNVWRFPYVAGQNGGGIFVLFYLIFLIAMGLPVLTMELAVGRASRKSAVLGYKALEKPNSKWHIHGWVAIFGCYMLMMYYTTVSGWMVTYFYKFVKGEFIQEWIPSRPELCSAIFGRSQTDGILDDTDCCGWILCMQPRLAERIGKISKVMMKCNC